MRWITAVRSLCLLQSPCLWPGAKVRGWEESIQATPPPPPPPPPVRPCQSLTNWYFSGFSPASVVGQVGWVSVYWDRMFGLQLLSGCGSMSNCLSRSTPDIHFASVREWYFAVCACREEQCLSVSPSSQSFSQENQQQSWGMI